ncbi:hypothetical protein CUR85_09095 [Sulfitobacter faviae]|nr:hypothetical protein [Sulfitobacter faviae]
MAELPQHGDAVAGGKGETVSIDLKTGDPRGLAASDRLGPPRRAAGEGEKGSGRAGDVIGQGPVAEAKGGLLGDRCG